MMFRKILAFSFAIWMMLFVVACTAASIPSEDSEPEETTSSDPAETVGNDASPPSSDAPSADGGDGEEEPPKETRWIDLVVGSKAEYTIVSDSPYYDDLVQDFANRLTQETGVSFYAKKNSERKSVTGKKIQVGRSPSSLLPGASAITYDGILSIESGRNLHITGYHEGAIRHAMDEFVARVATQTQSRDEDGGILFRVPADDLLFLENPESYAVTSPKIMGVPLSEFVVVIPEADGVFAKHMIRDFMDEIGIKTGVVLKCVTDKTSVAKHEIVIGKTNRAVSQSLYASLEEGYYTVYGTDGSLYVAYDNYLVMDDARKAMGAQCLDFEEDSILLSAKPNYASQMISKPSANSVRVMSTNIIAAADSNAVGKFDVNGMNYQLRMAIQGKAMMDYLPDFVGLQEMQEGTTNGVVAYMHSELLKTVGSEYSYVEYPELSLSAHWTPILYRHTVWQIVEKDILSSSTFDNAMHRWQWAVFSRIDDPSNRYILLNLHYPTGQYVAQQMAAAALVNEQIKYLQEKYPDAPVFLTGDFNTRSSSNSFAATFEGTGLVTANMSATAIDHVVYDPSLVECLGSICIENGWIPLTSDHRPVIADVVRKT